MTNTTYYNLNIVEGTDIVNPLTVDNPNYEKIDEAMHDNAVSGVTLATEIANATVHAITRENSECAVMRFIATSEWKAGDTATVDGVPVTTLLPSGETLPDGAYVINSNVLCILTGTNMTVFVERKKTDNAYDIKYNDTNVGAVLGNLLSKTDFSNTIKLIETDHIALNAGDNVAFGWTDFDNDPASGLVLSKCKKFKNYLPSDWNQNNTIIIWGNLVNDDSWSNMAYVYNAIKGKDIVSRAINAGNYYKFIALIMKIN